MVKAWFLILIYFTASGCRSTSTADQRDLESLLKSKIGASHSISYNASKNYALCQQISKSDHASRKYKYIMVKLADLSIVHEGWFQNGYARWLDDVSVEVGSSGANEKIKTEIISINVQKS